MSSERPISQDGGGRPISRQCEGHVDSPDGTRRRCRRSASHGSNVCTSHGAAAPQVRARAAERVAEAQAIELLGRYSPNGDRAPVDVPGSLAAIISEIRAFAVFMGDRLAEFTAAEWHYSHPDRYKILAEVRVYERAVERAGKILIEVGRLGVEAAVAGQAERLERARAERIVEGVQAGLDYMGLTLEQRKRAQRGLAVTLLFLAGEWESSGD
jgi:hypothetical protein